MPTGVRKGTMELELGGPKLTGSLTILGRTEPVEGVLNRDGSCTLHGRFRGMLTEVVFSAVGRVDCQQLVLELTSGNGRFHMTGTACPQTEEETG